MADALLAVERLIAQNEPAFIITANVNYAMLSAGDPRLHEVNRQAAFLLADGMPLVWASRWKRTPLPCRVAGSDLVPQLCARAADKHYRVFFLGGAPGVAEQAANSLLARHTGLEVAGIESPQLDELSETETEALKNRIHQSGAHILLAALGQPKGELWLAQHYQQLGVPLCVQIGASLDFVAGRVRRAPRWMQSSGLEWAYRLCQEPRRLAGRYARNAWFLGSLAARRTLQRLAGQPR